MVEGRKSATVRRDKYSPNGELSDGELSRATRKTVEPASRTETEACEVRELSHFRPLRTVGKREERRQRAQLSSRGRRCLRQHRYPWRRGEEGGIVMGSC
jgi:hypothetical protein